MPEHILGVNLEILLASCTRCKKSINLRGVWLAVHLPKNSDNEAPDLSSLWDKYAEALILKRNHRSTPIWKKKPVEV